MWVGGFRTAEVGTGAIVHHVKRFFSLSFIAKAMYADSKWRIVFQGPNLEAMPESINWVKA